MTGDLPQSGKPSQPFLPIDLPVQSQPAFEGKPPDPPVLISDAAKSMREVNDNATGPEKDKKRFFSAKDRAALYVGGEGRRVDCGEKLGPDFHADHREAHANGGVRRSTTGRPNVRIAARRKAVALRRNMMALRRNMMALRRNMMALRRKLRRPS